ncbi:1-phosphatidylinositol 4,5-bisphosphate phosphodiesterase delta-3-A [Brachyhypopomus gauderio]|uniref:1-phosphatidylinositol 4,5-bisphosphate phosphodiesterase delta-3-A n=1 Tax=Brachyhypopomus gauderio TaxID=698409 RepID=UPI004042CB2E
MSGSGKKENVVRKNGAGMSEPKSDNPLINLGVQDDEDVKAMLQGTAMLKVRSPHWQRRRTLQLLADGVTVRCESSKSFSKPKSFSVMEVECVREGCQSETLRRLAGSVPEERCMTIVFKGGRKSLDLQCSSQEEALRWARGLHTLQERVNNMSQSEKLDHWIHAYLKQADLNRDGKMTYDEVQTLLQMINIDLNEQYASSLFKKCDQSADGRLDHNEIELFCRELLRRPELDAVFQQYSSNGRVLSTVDLRDFLKDQGEDSTLVHAQSLILNYELNEWARNNQLMTANGFTVYMLSKENDVFDPEHGRVCQDMSRPLSHYFISSSHNTYLTKDQVMSKSSTHPYIRALSNGCRCVELDCWDGDKEPVICHGHTLTSKVPFREVVETIAEYAFKASPYPLILSLENHCSLEQQAVMAQQMRAILGDKLLTKPLTDQHYESLPSPEELRGKILVKGKKEHVEQESCSSSESSCSEDESRSESRAEGGPKARKDSKKCACASPAKVSKLSPELSDLVVYTRTVPFRGFDQAAKRPPNEMSSFSESEALKHIKNSGKFFVRANSQQLSRIYPSGQRLQSSNYNPQDMWNAGCQIVALNFQTLGEQMDLNQGRFLPNGRCGYVLKPSFLSRPDSEFNPENTGGGPGHEPTLLAIKIISAQQLPKPDTEKLNSIVDPLVWVETHGTPVDNNKKKTHRVDNNGFNPRWDCTFKFLLHVPELVLVRFVVEDHDYTTRNEFLGQFTLPFPSMRSGYRHVRLLGEDGSSLSPASLFIHVKVTPNYGSPRHPVSPKA